MTWNGFHAWVVLFPAAVLVHNLEESIWLPDWSTRAGRWHPPVGAFEFRFAAAVLTLLAIGAAASAWTADRGSWSASFITGYAATMLLNVLFPHVLASVTLRRYMPGTVTAIALILPISTGLLSSALHEGYVSWPWMLASSAIVVVFLLAFIPALFALGRRLTVRGAPGA